MVTIKLNSVQCWKLYQFLETQGKGAGFMMKMQRLYCALGVERIEEAFERNQTKIESFTAAGKPIPKDELEVFRATDPPVSVEIELPDLEWIGRRIRAWEDESEPAAGKSIEPGQAQDWRIYLPIIEAVRGALAAAGTR